MPPGPFSRRIRPAASPLVPRHLPPPLLAPGPTRLFLARQVPLPAAAAPRTLLRRGPAASSLGARGAPGVRSQVRRVEFFAAVRPIWRCILFTYLWICAAISACVVLFLALLLLVCNLCAILGYPPEIIVYPALLVVLVFSIVYAHTIIVCNLAGVVSVLEEISGLRAFLRSVRLIRGKRQVGLLMFLGSTIGMGFVQGLFEHRVKTVSYGDGSSRLWEGPLLVFMYSFVVLVDSMMSAVFYFTCRSSIIEETDEDVHELEEKENVSTEVTDIK